MSSSPTGPTSTTASSTSSPSPNETASETARETARETAPAERSGRLALVACSAIAQPAAQVVERRGWPVDVHPLPPLLHNQPHLIAGRVRDLATSLAKDYGSVAVGYADCGTYGALDEVCDELGLRRLPGLHCYDLFAGASELAADLDAEPGT